MILDARQQLRSPAEADAAAALQISSRERSGGVCVLSLVGELNITCADRLTRAVVSILRLRAQHVIVDLSQVDFIDASGLRALLTAARDVGSAGRLLVLAGPSSSAARVFEIVGLERIVAVMPSIEAAVASLPGREATLTSGGRATAP